MTAPKFQANSRRDFLSVGSIGVASVMTGLITHSHSAATKPTDLTRCTVVELVDLIRRKEVSSLEVVDACLERIRQVNPKLNAVVMLVAEDARAQARVADQRQASGDAMGALHGVPMTIKDSLFCFGFRCVSRPLVHLVEKALCVKRRIAYATNRVA